MMEPDAGDFTVAGISSTQPDEIRRLIGVLPENLGFPKHITGIEYLTYFGQLYGRTARDAKAHGLRLLEEVGLENRARSLLGSYSHGMRQRIGIARALVNDPVVVFLDEPTLGLDPRGQQELLALIRRTVQDRHVGVILCSHALWEIEVVCDDVVIMNKGQVAAAGTVSEVVGRGLDRATQRNALRIQVPPDNLEAARTLLAGHADVREASTTGEAAGWLRVELMPGKNGAETQDLTVNNRILEVLIRGEIPILNFEAAGGRLNEVFLQLTEERVK
jgi:ABC-2 type transport system ATP-binding protein